jgi:penicillin-binding protein 1A
MLIVVYIAKDIPDVNDLKTNVRNPSIEIQTYDGQIIGSSGDLYEDVVSVEDLPAHVPQAFMAIEDRRFLYHFGLDIVGFVRALYQNYISGQIVQGGSTITQQLAKNILVLEGMVTHYDRSISRKIKELVLAFWLERKFSKSQIMMMYLNRVYFGAGAYGIDAASKKYFNKSAKNINTFEAAVLAGLLKAPSKYSPFGNFDIAKDRAKTVLLAMENQGYITDANEILKSESAIYEGFGKIFERKKLNSYMFFCDYIYDQARRILGDITEDIVVVSTFNPRFQQEAEKAIETQLKKDGELYKISQAAFVCLGKDGAILAMVGGRSYTSTQFNRVTQAYRQMGSAFKVFVYGAALEFGYQVYDMISDAPINVAGWRPSNYKWRTRGSVSVLDAFTHSVNSVTIRLAQSVGLKRIANFCAKVGIEDVSTTDLSVAIGSGTTSLLSLTAAYGTFIDGNPVWSYGIIEIRSKTGEILYQREKVRSKKIIDNEVLKNLQTILRAVIERGTGRAANVFSNIYGKTGTNGDTDAWFISFAKNEPKDRSYIIGVWCGNDSMKDKMAQNSTGGRVPTRIGAAFYKGVAAKENKEKEDEPAEEKTATSKRNKLMEAIGKVTS